MIRKVRRALALGSMSLVFTSTLGGAAAQAEPPTSLATHLASSPSKSAEGVPATCTLEPTLGLAHIELEDRSYDLYVPSSLRDTRAPVPLLLMFAGSGTSVPDSWGVPMTAAHSGWIHFSEEYRFIVAFPNGYAGYLTDEDVGFPRRVVASVRSKYCIDRRRIFPTGWSAGAILAQHLACHASDLFASATGFEGWNGHGMGLPGDPPHHECLRPVAVGLFHGDVNTGQVSSETMRETAEVWSARNRCRYSVEDRVLDGTITRHLDCDRGVEVMRLQYVAQDHTWPVGPRQQDMLTRMWTFMNEHPLPRKQAR